MAITKIRGYSIQIGGDTTGLDKALKDTNKEIKNTQSQLRDVEKLLKMDPGNTELLAQKQRLLAEAVQETDEKLEALKQAEKKVQDQFKRGDVGQEEYDALKREIIATEGSLEKFKRQAAEAKQAVEKIDEDPIDDVADAAKKAGDAMDDAGKDAADFGDILKADLIADGVKGLVGGIKDLNEQTQEYRKIMGTLDVSSEAAGYSADETSEAFQKLYGVLGDDQTAATTLANLQAIGLDQSDLLSLIDQTTGAWATYGDSIPIDGLAEAINETVKTGKVTGTLADALNWAGTSEDAFNEILGNTSDESERARIIMEEFATQGLGKAGEAWEKNNADIVAANKAQAEFAEKTAALSERTAPAMTAVQEGTNDLLQILLDLTEDVDMDAVVSGINTLFKAVGNLIKFLVENKEIVIAVLTAIGAGLAALKVAKIIGTIKQLVTGVTTLTSVFPALGGVIGALTNPIFLVTAAVVAFVALLATKGDEIQAMLQRVDDFLQNVFATDWTTIFGPILGEQLNGFFAVVKDVWDSIKLIFDGIIDFIRGTFTGEWRRAWEGVKGIFKGILDGLVGIAKAPINGVIALLNGMIQGINSMVRKINNISFKNPFTGSRIGFNIGYLDTIPYLAKGGKVLKGSAIVGEAGPEMLTVANGRTIVQPLGRIEEMRPVAAGAAGSAGGSVNYTQNIYSPKALSTYEIYRQSQQAANRIRRIVQG